MQKMSRADLVSLREKLLKAQNNTCPLCDGTMSSDPAKVKASKSLKGAVLDHDHSTGVVRDVLCRNCNGHEGKILSSMNHCKNKLTPREWLTRLINYWDKHEASPRKIVHNTHKTPAEMREIKNRQARAARAALKKKSQ